MLFFFFCFPFTDFITMSVVAMQHVHPANGSRAFGRVEQQFGLMCVKRWEVGGNRCSKVQILCEIYTTAPRAHDIVAESVQKNRTRGNDILGSSY